MSRDDDQSWDVFISYASEDRTDIAEPLAKLLQAFGLRVWFDRTELKVGDSIRRSIQIGLSQSRHGVVILSKAFFAKHYTVQEFDGLAQREASGQPVILPVWHGVTSDDVRQFSLSLADRVAADTSEGVAAVAWKILAAVQPEVIRELEEVGKYLTRLSQLTNVKAILDVLQGAHAYNFANEGVEKESEAELLAEFLGQVEDWDVVEELEPSDRLRCELHLGQTLHRLHDGGWQVFGRRARKFDPGHAQDTWVVAALVLARADVTEVVETFDGRFAIFRKTGLG